MSGWRRAKRATGVAGTSRRAAGLARVQNKIFFKEKQTVKHSGTIKLPSSVLLPLMQANIHYVREIKTSKSIYCIKFIVIRANRWSRTPERDTEIALPLGRHLMVSFAFLFAFFHMERLIEPSLLLLCFTYMTVTRPECKTLNPKLSGMFLGGKQEKDSEVVAVEEAACFRGLVLCPSTAALTGKACPTCSKPTAPIIDHA